MRTQEPTFWPLNGQVDPRDGGRRGWRVSDNPQSRKGVAISQSAIRLAAAPTGPLSLTWPDDSLGGPTLPQGMALAGDGILYLLGQGSQVIKRFDPQQRRFVPLPDYDDGPDTYRFRQAASLAIHNHNLYVADVGAGQVKVFALPSLMLRFVFGAEKVVIEPQECYPPEENSTSAGAELAIFDLAAHPGGVYLLDGRAAQIYEHVGGTDHLRLFIQLPQEGHHWRRIAVDKSGRVYVLDLEGKKGTRLVVFDRTGEQLETINDAGEVRDRFDPLPIRLFYSAGTAPKSTGRFCLPQSLAHRCDRRPEGTPLERPLLGCLPARLPTSAADLQWRVKELKQPVRLAERLRAACDRVSRYIWSQLSKESRQQLDGWSSGPLPDSLRQRLVLELNRLQSKPDLYDPQSFALVPLSAETQILLKSQPTGLDRLRLNRMLLEEVFTHELAHSAYTLPPPLIFTREGEPAALEPDEPLGPALYERYGYWVSQALDSGIYNCQWHRIELELSALPAGTQVRVSTWSADEDLGAPSPGVSGWQHAYTVAGTPDGENRGTGLHEFLVQSREGQFLWLKIELFGDGFSSPAIKGMRVHFPRNSYLNYLPAIYSADDESRWFLERFLSVVQTEWAEIEQRLEDIAALFDPAAVPAQGGFLEALAGWLALPLEGEWTAEQKRTLLKIWPRIYRQRGTVEGLREYLRAYILNMTNLTEQELAHFKEFPALVEGFRERRRLMLSQPDDAALGLGTWLWSPGEVGRLQLGAFSQVGQVRLVSTGDPVRDIFHEFAHRFRVLVPAAWVRTANGEAMLRRALDAEKPAQTSYQLCLIEPRFRVGVQSTVGLDTIIGAYPAARLACEADQEAAPSRPSSHRLGYDTILSSRPAEPLQLASSLRLEIDTILR